MKIEHNTPYHHPNPDNTSVGINSKYIKVEAISCFGCKNIRNVKCFGQAEQGTFEEEYNIFILAFRVGIPLHPMGSLSNRNTSSNKDTSSNDDTSSNMCQKYVF